MLAICRRFFSAAFCAVAAVLCACGGQSSNPSLPPGMSGNPPPTTQPSSPPLSVIGYPAAFTEYPLPAGVVPADVAVGPDGALWFANFPGFDTTAQSLGELSSSGAANMISLPAGLSSGSGALTTLAGAVWSAATNFNQDEALLMRAAPGSTPSQSSDMGVCCGSPVHKIIAGPDGNVWVAMCRESCAQNSAVIASFTTFGTAGPSVTLGNPSAGVTYESLGIAAGPDRNIYAIARYTGVPPAPASDSSVFQISTSGNVLKQFMLPNGSDPGDIVAGPDGNLWITETGTNGIARMNTSGSFTQFAIATADAGPQRIAVGSDGALWFTEDPGNALGRIATDGTMSQYPVPTANAHPYGIVSCPSGCENAHGRIWFSEKIGKIGKLEY